MRSLRCLLAVFVCATGLSVNSGPTRAADRFLSAIEDLPLMPELAEIDGSAVVFSTPGGRIVEIAARGRIERTRVLAFYGETLPQLGWRAAGAASWEREGERLSITFETADGSLVVQYSLSPL